MTHEIKGGKWVILYSDSTVDSFYYEIVLVVTKTMVAVLVTEP